MAVTAQPLYIHTSVHTHIYTYACARDGQQGAHSVSAAARRGWPAPYANYYRAGAEHSG